MNILGISLPGPSSSVATSVPQGAPIRPGKGRVFAVAGFALLFTFLALFSEFHPFFVGLAIVFVPLSLGAPVVLWRRYERIGWYEQHEVVVPDLLFEMKGEGQHVTFGKEGITFSGLLGRAQTIAYSEIVSVSLDCEGDCLSGVTVSRNTKPYYSATEPRPPQGRFHISDNGNGERTRTAIALLRAMAPHAAFTGPQWVADGWVPRIGFAHPTADSGGGG